MDHFFPLIPNWEMRKEIKMEQDNQKSQTSTPLDAQTFTGRQIEEMKQEAFKAGQRAAVVGPEQNAKVYHSMAATQMREVREEKQIIDRYFQTALESLIQLTVETWRGDKTRPSVTLSYLPDKKEWYGSLIRYQQSFGRDGQVQMSHRAPTLPEVITQLADFLLSSRDLEGRLRKSIEQVRRRQDKPDTSWFQD